MIIPKLKFIVGKVEDYYSIIDYFIKLGRRDMFLKSFPNMPEDNLKNYFLKKEIKLLPIMEKIRNDFEKSWEKINNLVFEKLSEIIEKDWREESEEYVARVTLLPICPRYLDYNTFDLNFSFANKTMRTMCLHELSHFLFFEKVKEVYPEEDKKDFEKPGTWWKFSEIIPAVIFDDFKIFDLQEEVIVYGGIRKLEIHGRRILDIFKEFYKESQNFEEFMEKGYELLKENKDLIIF